MIRGLVELGWIDINLELSMFFNHLEIPRVDNLSQVLHAFAYSKFYPYSQVVMDPSTVNHDEG